MPPWGVKGILLRRYIEGNRKHNFGIIEEIETVNISLSFYFYTEHILCI